MKSPDEIFEAAADRWCEAVKGIPTPNSAQTAGGGTRDISITSMEEAKEIVSKYTVPHIESMIIKDIATALDKAFSEGQRSMMDLDLLSKVRDHMKKPEDA